MYPCFEGIGSHRHPHYGCVQTSGANSKLAATFPGATVYLGFACTGYPSPSTPILSFFLLPPSFTLPGLKPTFRQLIAPTLKGIRVCWPALALIQLGAFLAVASYYLLPGFQQFCADVAGFKAQSGWVFAAIGSTVSNALVPELLRLVFGIVPRTTLKQLLHQMGMFCFLGVLVDRFYILQSAWFGSGKDPLTLATKIAVDQFGYTLLVALPFVVLWYLWQENGYGIQATLAAATPGLIARRVLTLAVGNCCFWIPALVALYSLPTELQFLLGMLLGAAWSLILVYMARRRA